MQRHLNSATNDTAHWADRMLVEHWRSLSPNEKLQIMSEASIAVENLSVTGLRLRYPNDPEEDLRLRAAALRIGVDEFERWTGRTFQW